MNKDVLVIMDKVLNESKLINSQWEGKRFEKIRQVQIDKRGEVGENFVAECFVSTGKNVTHNNVTNPSRKDWDLVIKNDNVFLEIKTASLGSDKTFQHENLDKNRKYDGVIFLDIAPDDLYMVFVAKHLIPWKKLHRYKDSIAYKWDWSLKSVLDKKITDLCQFSKAYEKMLEEIRVYKARQKPKNQL